MYDRILLPTDGAESMGNVIDHAIDLAEAHDAQLHTMYVANTTSLADLPIETSWEGVSNALKKEGEEAIETVEKAADEQTIHSTLVEGSPAEEIVDYASTNEIDVIVMGTHGRSGVDRLLLGSVAERVIRSTQTPVLTIGVE